MNKINVKRSAIIIAFCIVFLNVKRVYGISDSFKYIIDTIGIPRYNAYGTEINEEIYNAYNVFSYGWPENLSSNEGQRWKNSKYGLWSKGVGAYKGYGIRGEFNLLGRDYSGNIINNYYFPVDMLPETTPEYWAYYSNPGAKESWKDTNKYKYLEQLNYMQNTKLVFNDISSRDNSDNPEKMKEYNITAKQIGLDKARLDVCSTWKTNGIVHARRKVGESIRYVVFLTKPMAANAKVRSSINVSDDFVLKETENEIEIEISYGADVENMTGYAREEHIKEISSKLYINGKEVEKISGSKTKNVGKKYILKLSREALVEDSNNKIEIVNNSYAHTEFAVDGLMQDTKTKTINIFVEKEKIIPLKFDEIRILEKNNDTLVVSPLAQLDVASESLGVTEAGRYIAIKLNINKKIDKNNIMDMSVHFDDEKIDKFELLSDKNNKNVAIKLKIPEYISSSIYGWKSLRETYGDYFSISEADVGKRIDKPHIITIKFKYNKESYIERLKIDTIDDFVTNINYTYRRNLVNNKTIKLEEWLA